MKIQIEEADLRSVLEALEDAKKNHGLVYVTELCDIREALAEKPAQQDIPKIGCVNHDCDKCKAQQQELDDLYAERKETVLGMLAYSTSLEEEIKRLREESQFNYMTGYEVARAEFQQRIQELEALLKEKNQ